MTRDSFDAIMKSFESHSVELEVSVYHQIMSAIQAEDLAVEEKIAIATTKAISAILNYFGQA